MNMRFLSTSARVTIVALCCCGLFSLTSSYSVPTTKPSTPPKTSSPWPFLAMSHHHPWVRSIVFATVVVVAAPVLCLADEYGVEKDAPTFSTGETVEICTKRGPLGACLKTELRTNTNDNDVSKKYFRDPSELVKQKTTAMKIEGNDDGNVLVQKLRQQSVDNREKNDLYVARKTFEADQAASFGPFDRQVLIMNTDGKTFTLLDNPVAMRLKKAGFIDDKRSFLKQPSAEELKGAKTSQETGFLSGLFGGN